MLDKQILNRKEIRRGIWESNGCREHMQTEFIALHSTVCTVGTGIKTGEWQNEVKAII